jgi:hypothetical protein
MCAATTTWVAAMAEMPLVSTTRSGKEDTNAVFTNSTKIWARDVSIRVLFVEFGVVNTDNRICYAIPVSWLLINYDARKSNTPTLNGVLEWDNTVPNKGITLSNSLGCQTQN